MNNAATETEMNTDPVAELPTVRQDFEVPLDNLAKLEEKIAKLNKRAMKIGCPLITITVGEKFSKTHKDPQTDMTFQRHYAKVRVDGETPRVNGWDFMCTVEHLGEDGNVIRSIPGFAGHIPVQYRTAKPNCDHCSLARRRNDTYVLREVATGLYKQVGTNCLADFLRTTTPEMLASAAEFLCAAMDAGADAEEGGEGSGGRTSSAVNFVSFMTSVCAVVRVDGAFISRTKARIAEEAGDYKNAQSTVGVVEELMSGNNQSAHDRELRAKYKSTPEDAAKAETVIAWARENVPAMAAAKEDNDYLYNVSVVIKRDYLERRLLGIAGSVIGVYDRELARQAVERSNRDTSKSVHFGTKGERVIFQATLLNVYLHEGNFGTTYITKLMTVDGNVCTWFGSHQLEKAVPAGGELARQYPGTVNMVGIETGETVWIKATIKDHSEFKGIKQTVLSRADVVTEAYAQEEAAKAARKAARAAKKAAATGA